MEDELEHSRSSLVFEVRNNFIFAVLYLLIDLICSIRNHCLDYHVPPGKFLQTLNTYWTRPSPTSSLLRPDKVILGEAILFCTGAINWMLDEVKSNKCFIITSFIIPHQNLLNSDWSFTHQHFRCLVLSAFDSCHMTDIMLPCQANICHMRDIMIPCKPNIYHESFRKVILRRVLVLILIILKQCESERDNKLG